MSCLYEFNMSSFDHGNPEDFLLFISNFNMTLATSGTLGMDAKLHYLRTLVRGKSLGQFDLLSADVENKENLIVDYYIKGLAVYSSFVNFLKKSVMRRGIKKLVA